MELKEFIKTAITDITNAISELQTELNNGTIINPSLGWGDYGTEILVNGKSAPIERLKFDVAVTASDQSGTDGTAKVGISIFGANIGTESTSTIENVSRLTFSIPIVYPLTPIKSPQEVNRSRSL